MAKNRNTHVARPVYPGGTKAMRAFIGEQLKYPAEALSAKVEGTVKVRYTLDYRGKVVDAKVKSGIGHGCDEEAIRVVKLLRFNVPMDRKKKVRIHQDLQVHFHLPKQKTKASAPAPHTGGSPPHPLAPPSAPTATRIMYQLQPAAPKSAAKKASVKTGKSYTYTVKIK